MRGRELIVVAIGWLAITAGATAFPSAPTFCAEAAAAEDVPLTPSVIREIQFLLSRLSIDSGPIDGVVGPQTNKAIGQFQQRAGLPVTNLIDARTIPANLLAELRSEASRAILGETAKSQASNSAAAAVPAPAIAAKPAADRFAACAFNPQDFRIGGTQYTPDKFLQVGFDGSTARAVANLKDRLNEARQLAENIGGPALLEVQRQARVLSYFNCRLKIEDALKSNK